MQNDPESGNMSIHLFVGHYEVQNFKKDPLRTMESLVHQLTTA